MLLIPFLFFMDVPTSFPFLMDINTSRECECTLKPLVFASSALHVINFHWSMNEMPLYLEMISSLQ